MRGAASAGTRGRGSGSFLAGECPRRPGLNAIDQPICLKVLAMAVSFFGLGMMEVFLLMVMGGLNPGLLPSGLPPLPEDKALVSTAPEECLLYTAWYGTADPKGSSKN